MNHIDDRSVHRCRGDVVVCAQQQLPKRTTQLLRIVYIDGNEFEDTVLGNNAENVGAICLAVIRDERDTAGAGLEHAPTGFIEGTFGVNGDGLGWCDAQCLFHLYRDSQPGQF